jgi:hypothetical protein
MVCGAHRENNDMSQWLAHCRTAQVKDAQVAHPLQSKECPDLVSGHQRIMDATQKSGALLMMVL